MGLSQIGLLFNAIVTGSVGVIALFFMIYLFKRWKRLNNIMRSYAWFWFFTMLLWLWFAVYYIFAAANQYNSVFFRGICIIVQSAIFFTGPPLFYYLGLKVLRNNFLAGFFATISCILAFVSLFFILLPGGLAFAPVTNFTADMIINPLSMQIFTAQIVIILILLLYDIFSRFYKFGFKNQAELYEALYSLSLVIYVFLGAIDQSKIILDWPLVVFRVFYASAFLFSYLIISHDEMRKEEYFVENNNQQIL